MPHRWFLRGQDEDRLRTTAQAPARGALDSAGLNDSDRRLLDIAATLTRTPAAITDDDVAGLHAAGFSDEQVWEATFTTAIFAMFNRMAGAIGLTPPEHRPPARWSSNECWVLSAEVKCQVPRGSVLL
jgi:uncharacterized peroxidase-related enzyme